MPASSLVSDQLPFLNRFEKYILSVEDALQEKIKKRQWLQIQVDEKEIKQKNVIDVLQEGCNDMVEKLHVESQENRLLYGLVPKETVASFLYSVVERSVEAASRTPEIPPAFVVKSTRERNKHEKENHDEKHENQVENEVQVEKDGKQEVNEEKPKISKDFIQDEEEEEEENENFNQELKTMEEPINKLQEYIRKANFHLLQLARPESVFFCRKLPQAYVKEYLMNQEHFNVIRFLHHLLLGHFVANYKQDYQSNKWIIFTRASGEILRLHSDLKLKEMILTPLLEIDNEKFSIDILSVISLNSFASTSQCDNKVSEFFSFESKQNIMLCLADMSVCTSNQVNYFRYTTDNLMKNSNKMVIIILHYPPEMNIMSKYCYHAIFLNKWDYTYIDSLGVITGTDDITDHQITSVEADERSWIAKAFGLPVSHLSPETVKEGFKVTKLGVTLNSDIRFRICFSNI